MKGWDLCCWLLRGRLTGTPCPCWVTLRNKSPSGTSQRSKPTSPRSWSVLLFSSVCWTRQLIQPLIFIFTACTLLLGGRNGIGPGKVNYYCHYYYWTSCRKCKLKAARPDVITKGHVVRSRNHMLESSVKIVQSRAVARKLIDEITSAGRAFQSRALVTGKAVGTVAVSREPRRRDGWSVRRPWP